MLRQPFKQVSLTILIASMLLVAPITLAAQETPAETAQGPSGLMVLAFLLGAGGIILVGGMMLARDNFQGDDE